MAKRPGAAALAAGALFALCCPTVAAAQVRAEGEAPPREVSGGSASWATGGSALTGRGVSLDVTRPAVRASADRASFPALGGAADPESGSAELELGGAARFEGSGPQSLVLAGLRLRLAGDGGALYGRTVVDGRARELALAEVAPAGAGPVVRATAVTWTGLRASLTAEGAALLSSWSGARFTAGDGLGVLEVTAGTGETAEAAEAGETGAAAPEGAGSPQASPGAAARTRAGGQGKPTVAVARAALTAGAEQTVTGAGFTPGAVVLIAIDGDTRYQAVADARGGIARSFPVYANAFEGEHTVELTVVGGEQSAQSARFGVEAPH
ncbi:HtaA domain-containing protein [Streptomyces sp. NBC_00103]|uniref:HtaA domain-containing protein n=1 Tax=Streptomyces sp. NBC_00103 TaxID=2975653 RepID=UPI002254BFDD|nr:HtaA domain-containing protein [Streptomyces sp. NBC_00103]MCX5369999.1 HtaA domain-containing protein [Streptomyces sp. NBC_00103]